ncbi:hypothetical protein D3C77_563090 [compost metagenome]
MILFLGQVHAHAVHALEGHDGLCQLAFQAALEAYVLHELAGAQRLFLVEQLVTGRHADLDALGRQQHARAGQVGVAHQDLAAGRMHAVAQRLGVQHRHHLGGLEAFAAAIQRAQGFLIAPQVEHHQDRDQGGHGGEAGEEPARVELDATLVEFVQ